MSISFQQEVKRMLKVFAEGAILLMLALIGLGIYAVPRGAASWAVMAILIVIGLGGLSSIFLLGLFLRWATRKIDVLLRAEDAKAALRGRGGCTHHKKGGNRNGDTI